jgi:hypothetical protein
MAPMTAITLNLLVEEQLAERAEARDPFKLALAIGIGVITLTVVIGVILGFQVDRKRAEADALQAKWTALSKTQGNLAGSDSKSLRSQVDDIIAISNGRQFFAGQLAVIKDVVPESIQLGQIDLNLNVETQESARSEPAGDVSTAKRARTAAPRSVERLFLRLTGWATSVRPEMEVDQFIRRLSSHPVFGEQLKEVKLRSIARTAAPPSGGDTDSSASAIRADFVIVCQYKETR